MNWFIVAALWLILGGSMSLLGAMVQKKASSAVGMLLGSLFNFFLAYQIWSGQ